MRYALLFALTLICGCPAASAPPATPQAPKIDWAKALTYDVTYDDAQRSLDVAVRIAPGFHAYTTGETTGRPMKLQVDPPTTIGEVVYPKGIAKTLPIGPSVIVEGSARITAPVTAADASIKGTFAYQVCTDDVCDRPRNKKFEVAISQP